MGFIRHLFFHHSVSDLLLFDEICDLNEKHLQNFHHQISDLYIYGYGELVDLIYRWIKTDDFLSNTL